MNGRRGQSAILGLILLIGIVAIVSVGILVHAGQSTADAQQEMENERIEAAFVQLSQTMATTAATGDTTEVIDFSAGEHGAIVMTETGTMKIEGDGVGENGILEIDIGAIEYEGDDGTRIAYQAGGVFRETGAETQVVSAPPLHYNNATATFSFPIIEVADEGQLSSGDVLVNHTGETTAHRDATYVEDTVRVTITSDYCRGWETYFERQTRGSDGQAIRESCGEGDDDTVVVKLGRTSIDAGTFNDGIVANEFDISGSGSNADLDISEIERTPPPLDETINDMVTDASNSEDVTDLSDVSNNQIPAGQYMTDGLDVDEDYIFDVEDGDITLVVDGDINLNGGDLRVENGESNDHELQIFTTGDMYYSAGGSSVCVENCGDHSVSSRYLQIYGTSGMHIGMDHGNSNFEGIIYAPAGENGFQESDTNPNIDCDDQLCIQAAGDIFGSIFVSSADIHSAAPEGMYDESLEGFSPEINSAGYIFPPELTYLNIVEHKVHVEN